MERLARSVLLGVAVLWNAGGLTAATGEVSPLIVGLLLPPEEADTASIRAGVEFAAREANQTAGRPVRVIVRGRSGPWGSDATEAARLVSEDGAEGLIAPTSGTATHLALQIAGRTSVPVVSLCPDSSTARTGVPWMLPVVPSTVDEARALLAGLGVPAAGRALRFRACVPAGRGGRVMLKDLATAAKGAGWAMGEPLEIGNTQPDEAAIRRELARSTPDAILVWLDWSLAADVVRAFRAAGFKGTLAGASRLASTRFRARAGAASESFIVPTLVRDEREENAWHRFRAGFRQWHKADPDPAAAAGYDGGRVLIALLRAPAADPPRLLFPLSGAVPGATGTLRFDPAGHRVVRLRLLVCREEGFVDRDGTSSAPVPWAFAPSSCSGKGVSSDADLP
jgi:ABC-type branched-subunit amino acid transport system substrate-binding protein